MNACVEMDLVKQKCMFEIKQQKIRRCSIDMICLLNMQSRINKQYNSKH